MTDFQQYTKAMSKTEQQAWLAIEENDSCGWQHYQDLLGDLLERRNKQIPFTRTQQESKYSYLREE